MTYHDPRFRCGKCDHYPGNGEICSLNTSLGGSRMRVWTRTYACRSFYDGLGPMPPRPKADHSVSPYR